MSWPWGYAQRFQLVLFVQDGGSAPVVSTTDTLDLSRHHHALRTLSGASSARYTHTKIKNQAQLASHQLLSLSSSCVMFQVREMSEEQGSALKAPLEEEYRSNSRPLQPLNGRTVQLYDERRRRRPSC